jgi:hypothetical protein
MASRRTFSVSFSLFTMPNPFSWTCHQAWIQTVIKQTMALGVEGWNRVASWRQIASTLKIY